ncbi:MAG: DUF721 domain-containing protein [Candidatus Cloacimonadaceae bacterium]|jgi:predicted nucleic acid-binding Zn ribbon protein|nr:DUF721 domain-containing protein [Candidatus Cloacimonadota bacterium]MCB5257913.1 DUF721 domain-containing protein [Candidatus Cloacimonadota bacterium]MDD5624390.1 DUF721 domain-containing protein [Candidatus Cloacimonadota bacterium]MDY0112012.1 DUF721 domain-containing protein [Candidatus Syntrophosphaera sp.]
MAFTSLSNIKKEIINKIAGDKYKSFVNLYQGWKEIVGPLLAAKSHPFHLKDSILYVAVENNSWLQELILRKADIIKQLNYNTGEEIKDIIFLIKT